MKIIQIQLASQPSHRTVADPAEAATDRSVPSFTLLVWHNRCFLLYGSPERSSEARPSAQRQLAKAQRRAGRPNIGLFVPPVSLRRLQYVAVLKQTGRNLKDEARDHPRACACSRAIARQVILSFRPTQLAPPRRRKRQHPRQSAQRPARGKGSQHLNLTNFDQF